MANERRRVNTKRKKKKRSVLYRSVSFVVICAAMIFGMSVFFRVTDIEVTGASQYTKEEIIAASGIEEGDNLFFINRFTAISKIFSKLPFIEEVTITRSLPNKLLFEVTESTAAAYLSTETGFWIIDRGCKVLGSVSAEETASKIRVDGITPETPPATGQVIDPGEAERQKVDYLSAVLTAVLNQDMQGSVTYIDMSDVSNPSFDYLGRFTVKLGKNEDVDYKFELLLSAVSQLSEGDSGTIDLSIEKKAHFNPD
jgi:cell division protein FtsQ